MNLGMVAYQRGEYADAQSWLAQSVQMTEALGALFFNSLSRCFIGLAALAQGRWSDARDAFAGAVAGFRTNGSPRGLTIGLSYGVRLALEEHRLQAAHAMAREALHVSSLSHDRWAVGTALSALGRVALSQRDLDEARYLSREAAEIFEALDERWSLGDALILQGHAMLALGAQAEALRLFVRAAQLAEAAALPPLLLEALLGCAHARLQRQEWASAARLLRHIAIHSAAAHATRQRAESLYEDTSTHLAPEQIRAILSEFQGDISLRLV